MDKMDFDVARLYVPFLDFIVRFEISNNPTIETFEIKLAQLGLDKEVLEICRVFLRKLQEEFNK